MTICRVVSCVVGRRCLLWPVHSLSKILLAFALLHFILFFLNFFSLLHFILPGQACLLFQASLDFLLLHSNPIWWKRHLFFSVNLEGVVGLHACMHAKSLQSCQTLWDSMDYSLPGSSVHQGKPVGLHRTIQLHLLQHQWLGHSLGLLWCWVACLGNKLRSFCHFWGFTQVLHLRLLLTMRATPFLLRDYCSQE